MDCYIGTILPWAVDYAPQDWVLCQGQLLQVAQYQALFSLLGTKYGGDGKNTFGVPNLQGRFPMGVNPTDVNKQLGKYVDGPMQATITTSNLPAHNHTIASTATVTGNGASMTIPVNLDISIPVNTDSYPNPMPTPATYTNSPTNNNCTLATGKTGNNATTTNIYTTNGATTNATLKPFNVQKSITATVPNPTVTVSSTCNLSGVATSQAPVQIPYVCLNYIICVNGIYPVRP